MKEFEGGFEPERDEEDSMSPERRDLLEDNDRGFEATKEEMWSDSDELEWELDDHSVGS